MNNQCLMIKWTSEKCNNSESVVPNKIAKKYKKQNSAEL